MSKGDREVLFYVVWSFSWFFVAAATDLDDPAVTTIWIMGIAFYLFVTRDKKDDV